MLRLQENQILKTLTWLQSETGYDWYFCRISGCGGVDSANIPVKFIKTYLKQWASL